jgi:hypothetical protein
MNSVPISIALDEERLGSLAMRYRGTKLDAERREIAKDYSETVERLIQSGRWDEMPSPEDQLPDDCMPKAFFTYWLPQQAKP